MSWVEGEATAQSIGATGINTGAKTFGKSVPYVDGNPFLKQANNRVVIGMVVAGLVAALFIYKKVK